MENGVFITECLYSQHSKIPDRIKKFTSASGRFSSELIRKMKAEFYYVNRTVSDFESSNDVVLPYRVNSLILSRTKFSSWGEHFEIQESESGPGR
jgi:hypothetical protein